MIPPRRSSGLHSPRCSAPRSSEPWVCLRTVSASPCASGPVSRWRWSPPTWCRRSRATSPARPWSSASLTSGSSRPIRHLQQLNQRRPRWEGELSLRSIKASADRRQGNRAMRAARLVRNFDEWHRHRLVFISPPLPLTATAREQLRQRGYVLVDRAPNAEGSELPAPAPAAGSPGPQGRVE
jgi:hypothetical protein